MSIRALAVAATNDLISTALQYLKQPLPFMDQIRFSADPVWVPPPFPAPQLGGLIQAPLNLTILVDDLLFNFILPSFEKVFTPFVYLKLEWNKNDGSETSKPQLAPCDLLLSLKTLASVPMADVRIDAINGLHSLLQEGGHSVQGGWDIVFDLLMSIPQNMDSSSGNMSAPTGTTPT